MRERYCAMLNHPEWSQMTAENWYPKGTKPTSERMGSEIMQWAELLLMNPLPRLIHWSRDKCLKLLSPTLNITKKWQDESRQTHHYKSLVCISHLIDSKSMLNDVTSTLCIFLNTRAPSLDTCSSQPFRISCARGPVCRIMTTCTCN